MASLSGVCRTSARAAARSARIKPVSRSFSTSRPQWAASNFYMPAMSPTMTEGNIASWKVKEGDKFSAGDLLLEIETDKAQMDVEAQEDGVLAKIIQQDGSKSVKVGTRIAVFAEEDDDLSSLEIPADDAEPQQATRSANEESQSKESAETSSQQESKQQQQPQQQESEARTESSQSSTAASSEDGGSSGYYPFYPSVQRLLHTQGVSNEEANKIKATGPNGRLLKGDVLAYLGSIEKTYPTKQSERLSSLSHLDLSNIKKATTPEPTTKKSSKAAEPEPELPTQVAVPVSYAAVYRLQRRLQDSLGTSLPLATFIARASEIANEDLPRAAAPPSQNELFAAVLGLPSPSPRTSRGAYIPQITPLPAVAPAPRLPERRKRAEDVLDVLTGTKPRVPLPGAEVAVAAAAVAAAEGSVFSVPARKGEERRARTYLERVKSVLEAEPGRCVL